MTQTRPYFHQTRLHADMLKLRAGHPAAFTHRSREYGVAALETWRVACCSGWFSPVSMVSLDPPFPSAGQKNDVGLALLGHGWPQRRIA